MPRLGEHVDGLAVLEHAPGMQHGHGAADFCDHAEVMGDEQNRRAVALPKRSTNCSTWRCTVTSSAVVGSSAITRLGSQANAIAISTRCRIPPEISCG